MPITPLYQNANTLGIVKNGLGFAKFFDQWQPDWKIIEPDKHKRVANEFGLTNLVQPLETATD